MPYAEPSGTFEEPDINLFGKLDRNKTTTFYDSACGLPLFTAPINRTFDDEKYLTEKNLIRGADQRYIRRKRIRRILASLSDAFKVTCALMVYVIGAATLYKEDIFFRI